MSFDTTDPALAPAGPAAAGRPWVAPGAARLGRATQATRVQFAVLGMMGGAWGVHIPSVKTTYGLGEVMLSMVLLSAACGAVLSLFFAGRVIARLGAARAVMAGALGMGLVLAMVLQWPGVGWLLPTMVVFGASMSLFDVAINTEGTTLESVSGRTVMSNLHGMFALGAMAGAAIAGQLIQAGVTPEWQLAGFGVGAVLIAVVAARSMLEAHPPPKGDDEHAHFAWPRGLLLVIGLLIFAGMSAEGVMYDWCVLYLKQEVQMPHAWAAWGYSVFAGSMAAARFAGDWLRDRYPEKLLLGVSAGVSSASMALVLLSGDPVVSFIGYAFVGAGLAPVVPILFNSATRVPGVSRAAAIASVSSIGYAGFMIGPPLIGGLAHAASLTAAMGVVVLAAGVLALCSRRVP